MLRSKCAKSYQSPQLTLMCRHGSSFWMSLVLTLSLFLALALVPNFCPRFVLGPRSLFSPSGLTSLALALSSNT